MILRSPQLDRFIRAVHRRWVGVRLVERMGLCVLIGCAAGIVLIPILMMRGEPTLPMAAALILLGAVVGIIWGLIDRPTRLEAAEAADEQLGLADLLGTALCLERSAAEESWRDAVRAMAESRCASLSPSAVALNRWGARAWGGVGLATALLLTLTFVSSNPMVSRAGSDEGSVRPPYRAGTDGSRAVMPSRLNPSGASGGDSRQVNSPDQPGTNDEDPDRAIDGQKGTGGTEAGRDSAMGTGSARTRTQPANVTPMTLSPRRAGDAGTIESTGPGALINPSPAVAPWHSDTWAADRNAAMDDLRSGRVPDAYRDLVRKYFDHP